MNIVNDRRRQLRRSAGHAEGAAFGRRQLDELISLAERGIGELIGEQRRALGLA